MSSDDFPKAELFLGYQWLNPGGNIPDQRYPAERFQAALNRAGLWHQRFLQLHQVLALEGNYGGDWNRTANKPSSSGRS
jgi:hypothetical protein